VRAGHARSALAEPALVLSLPNPLKVFCGSPVVHPDLCGGAGDGVALSRHDFLGGGGGISPVP